MKEAQPINIVIVSVQNPVFGALLIPYTAQKNSDETIHLIEQAFHASPAVIAGMSKVERDAIEIAARYSEKKLMTVYSKEKNLNDFYKKLTDEKVKMIRTFIEKKLVEMLQLIRNNNLPLYQNQPGNKILYDHNACQVSPYISEVSFSFEADEKQFHYSLQCKRNDEEITLLEKKPVTVLTSSPASLLLGNELHLFHNIDASRILPFTNKTMVSVDVSLLDKYLKKVVLPILRYHQITFKGLPIIEEKRTCEPVLAVEENIYDTPVLRLTFNYGDQVYFPTSPLNEKTAFIFEEKDGTATIHYFHRNLSTEKRLVQFLKDTHMQLRGDSHFKLREEAPEKDMVTWILANKEALSKNFRLISSHNDAAYCLNEIRMEQDITENHDWFELRITIVIGDFRIPFVRFRKNILEGRREYILPDGKVVLLPEEWFSKYSDLFEYSEKGEKDAHEENPIRIGHAFIGLVQSALTGEENAKKISYQPKEETAAPPKLKAKLRHYQQNGFNWMIHLNKHGFNGCLADDMGLGKTLQTLALLQYMYDNSQIQTYEASRPVNIGTDGQLSLFADHSQEFSDQTMPVVEVEKKNPATLIVMPTSLLHNWRREIARFTTLSAYEYTGNTHLKPTNLKQTFDRYNLVLTSYGLMRKNMDIFCRYTFEYVVLDESQNIKNSDSQTFNSAMRLLSNHRMILTGTPIENSLKDLWSQFHFLQPELLGTESYFQKQFITPIKQGDKRVETRLQHLITPFILRRNKREVAPELPSLTEEIIYCDMTDEQKDTYRKEKNGLRNILLQVSAQKDRHNNLTILNGITRLRQLACHPRMIFDDFTGSSGKLEDIVSTFETLQSEGHKVLIFSSFVKHLELIAEAFEQNGWSYALLTGSSTNREEEITRFATTDHVQAFLISLKAGGVGLNLTQADYVFIIDPWWNPAAEMQAISRAHRIGQNKPVFAYRFITQESIEEKIIRLQEEKRKLSETFITDNDPLQTLTDKEWANLLEE